MAISQATDIHPYNILNSIKCSLANVDFNDIVLLFKLLLYWHEKIIYYQAI